MRRGGSVIRKPPYSARPIPGPTMLSNGCGGIERHVGFVLVLAEPGGQIGIAVVAILVEDHHDGADFARESSDLADIDLPWCQLRMVSRMSMPSSIEVVNGSTRTRSSERMLLAFFFRNRP